MRNVSRVVAVSLTAGLAASAYAIGPEVLFATAPTAPAAKRAVPGLPGMSFQVGTTTVFSLNRMFASADGNHWAFAGLADTGGVATTDQVVIQVDGGAASLVAREGSATPFDATRNYGVFDPELGINNAGTVAFANHLAGGATTDDELIARYTLVAGAPTYHSVPYREGQPCADAGVTTFIPAGATYGGTIGDPTVLNNGDVCALITLNLLAGQIVAADDETVYRGGVALHREQKTSPNAWPNLWDLFTGHGHSADGTHHILDGDDSSGIDDITTVDNAVVVQQGQIIPGLTTATATTGTAFVMMSGDGDWMARGNNTNADEDWVLYNGAVVANALGGATRDITPATPSGEVWDDTTYANCYIITTCNSAGHYIVSGVTNAATATNAVVVLDGATVIAREGDPIDLDGNGIFDDNVFLRTIGDDTGFLTDDGWFYMRISLTDNPTVTQPFVGWAIIRIRAYTPAGCYANCDASTAAPILNVADFTCFLQKFAGNVLPYANCDQSTATPVLNVADFTCFLQKFAAGCP